MTTSRARIQTALKEQWAGSEFSLHRFTVDLLRFRARRDVLWFHPPNGEYRSPRTGARLKAMGVIPGVADFVIVVKGIGHFLELKTARGRQSPEQMAFADHVAGAGALYMIARSPEAVENILDIWGALVPTSMADIARKFNAAGASGSVARRVAA